MLDVSSATALAIGDKGHFSKGIRSIVSSEWTTIVSAFVAATNYGVSVYTGEMREEETLTVLRGLLRETIYKSEEKK